MTALFMLTQYFTDLGLDDLVVVAPDAGRVKLNKKFASKIGAELAILDKERPAQQVAEIGYVIGDVRGQDRPDRGRHDRHRRDAQGGRQDGQGSGRREGLRGRDPRGLLRATRSRTCARPSSSRSSSPTRSPCGPGVPENVRVLPCAELLTDSIRRIFVDDSVSEVFGGENQLF